tara:strand:+ start:64 stop:303 length:240 start_codon:yes stop_codon:yes gene_type:complete
MSLNKPIIWYKVRPFNFIIPKLNKSSGNDRINLPAIKNNIANMTEKIKINILNPFDIFFADVFAMYLNIKYTATKITSE